MKKYLIPTLILSSLLMSGCAVSPTTGPKPDIVEYNYSVVLPDDKLYDCPAPIVKKYASGKVIYDNNVAKLIVYLYKNNMRCYNSVLAIKKFLRNAANDVNSENSSSNVTNQIQLTNIHDKNNNNKQNVVPLTTGHQ